MDTTDLLTTVEQMDIFLVFRMKFMGNEGFRKKLFAFFIFIFMPVFLFHPLKGASKKVFDEMIIIIANQ